MTEALYMDDCYIKEFEAKVVEVLDKSVVLDKTAFYPKGGGQPPDYGTIIRKSDNKEFKVTYTGKVDSKLIHETEPGLQVGDEVIGKLDWERRYKIMKMHTAAHVISALINKKTGALITGNQLDLDKSRIDFNLEEFDREMLLEYINNINILIENDADIKIYYMDREEAMKIPEMCKLAGALPPAVDKLRVVEIENVDKQADGGTHVNKLSEIGKIEILELKNKGKNNRRMYFTVN